MSQPSPSQAWQPIEDLDLQDLDGQLWLATWGGQVLVGEYEWRQGHEPDGFNTIGAGRLKLRDVTHCMPFIKPQHPNKGIAP